MAGLQDAWNSRFGLYKNGGGSNPQLATSPPDFTGYAYDPNTPRTAPFTSVYRTDYPQRRQAGTPFSANQAGLANNNFSPYNTYNSANWTAANHQLYGRSRRVVVAPIVDCGTGASTGQTVPVKALGCFFMLSPFPQSQGGTGGGGNGNGNGNGGGGSGAGFSQKLEFLGLLTDPNTPCSLSGAPGGGGGGTGGSAAAVPYLVQ
jgi:hypothetical protein